MGRLGYSAPTRRLAAGRLRAQSCWRPPPLGRPVFPIGRMNTVQLTSATGTEASQRSAGGSILARLDRPMAAGLIAFTAWLAFVLARWQTWAHGQITLFIMSGVKYSHPAQMSPPISHVPRAGYDGQFYYRLAL